MRAVKTVISAAGNLKRENATMDEVKINATTIKKTDPARIRTWNLLIRSQTPYPLGHRAFGMIRG